MDFLTEQTILRYFYMYVMRLICVVGIFGNIVILVVLSQRGANITAFVYIKALAGVDLVICVMLLLLGFVRCGDCTLSRDQQYYKSVYEAYLYLPIANTGQMANLFITIAMAVHRAVSVLQMRRVREGYSLRVDVLKSRFLAKVLVWIIIAVSIAINLVRFFFYTVTDKCPKAGFVSVNATDQPLLSSAAYNLSENTQGDTFDEAWPPAGQNFQTTYVAFHGVVEATTPTSGNTTTNGSFSYGAPEMYCLNATEFNKVVNNGFLMFSSGLHFSELVILTTVNIILIKVLRRSKSQRSNLIPAEIRHRRKRDDVTRLLVVVVVLHIICHLHSPFSADPIAQQIFGQEYLKSNQYQIQLALNNTLTLTSHAVTIFVYLVCAKFRKQLCKTWKCILELPRRKEAHWNISASATPLISWNSSYSKGGVSPTLRRNHSTVCLRQNSLALRVQSGTTVALGSGLRAGSSSAFL